MKNKFYALLLIGIGLTIASMPSVAKSSASKKTTASATKSTKTSSSRSKKSETTASKKTSNKNTKQSKSDDKTKSSHASKTRSQSKQLTKNNESNTKKTKSSHVADNKNKKYKKPTNNQLAKSKKSKSQQFAATQHKHNRKKSHQVEEAYVEENDEEVAVETDDNFIEENHEEQSTANNPSDKEINAKHDTKSELIPALPKSSQLFFQPLDKQTTDLSIEEEKDNAKKPIPLESLIASPSTTDSQMSSRDRIHAIDKETKSKIIADEDNEELRSSSDEDDNALITAPKPSNKRIHTSISRDTINSIVNNQAANETVSSIASAHGVVGSSLTSSGKKAGLSRDMIIELTDIFAWDVDFANNLQEDDQFTVIYENGSGSANNKIIAAQFVNDGKTYTAIRYKNKEGIVSYYTPEGRSLRKAFLTTPVDFARVSSHFSTHRHHPILNRIRAHKGVDYAARTGTPVKAAGDGVITFHGTKGGYGRMIVISHGEHYETAYAHLSNFRKGLQDGEPVKQGDVIGYVGQSGLATGPHLHYEFRVDGVHRDPEKLDSKQAMRLTQDEWRNFHAQTIPVLTKLHQAQANGLFAKTP